MVRNLYIENNLPPRPTRFARNNAGPGESNVIAVAMSSMAGSVKTPIAIPNVISSERLMRSAAAALRLQALRDLGSIAAGNA